ASTTASPSSTTASLAQVVDSSLAWVINFERSDAAGVSPQTLTTSPEEKSVTVPMKKTLSWAAAGLCAATFVFVGQAKAELKVGTIDMQKVFTAYYKTKEVEEKLNDAQK